MASVGPGGTVQHLAPASLGQGPRNHVVHFYDDDPSLVRIVTAFLGDGLAAGDSAIAIATAAHTRALDEALAARGIDVAAARRGARLVTLDADEALEAISIDGTPDAEQFEEVVVSAVDRATAASASGRVRAYGEMVNELWARGSGDAVLRLEEIWSDATRARPVSLLCAYLLDGFADAAHAAAFRDICERHGAILPTERYAILAPDAKLRRVAELEQRARALEEEIARRVRVEREHAATLAAERRARAEVTALYRLTDAANRAETLDAVFAVALDGIAAALGVEKASILLFDSDGVMRFKAWRGLSDAYRAAVEGHTPWRPDTRDPPPVLVPDVRADAALAGYAAAFEREGIGALAFFPLYSGGTLLGKFMVYHAAPHAFGDEETRLAHAIADQIAFAVDRRLAAQERERVLGIVGHDLRNPLGAVVMSAQALLRQEVSERTARLVRRIVTSSERMERLLRQLLDFTQARQGSGLSVLRGRCDLAEIARHVVDECEAAHPDCSASLEESGDAAGEWDGDRLAEVLSNLVGNAIQHGAGSAVRVAVRDVGSHVVAEVHNGGPPIPPALQPNLFDPFRRGVAGAGRAHHVGLGLFISREIVRAHGGTIEVRSTAEAGTTFTVRLPRRAPAAR
jgi:signal transduction histidine kinase